MDHSKNSTNSHLFNFYGPDEIGTVSAVFSEYIENLVLKGNDSSVDPYHVGIVNWDENATLERYQTTKPKNFLKMLNDYVYDTEQVVTNIMSNEINSDSRIEQVAQRYRFGYHAGILALVVTASLESDAVPNEDVDET